MAVPFSSRLFVVALLGILSSDIYGSVGRETYCRCDKSESAERYLLCLYPVGEDRCISLGWTEDAGDWNDRLASCHRMLQQHRRCQRRVTRRICGCFVNGQTGQNGLLLYLLQPVGEPTIVDLGYLPFGSDCWAEAEKHPSCADR